jgi:hypothetical protein
MSFIPSGSSSYGNDDRRYSWRDDEPRGLRGLLRRYFAPFVQAVKEHGLRGLLALVIAAAIAFAPAGLLIWFNHLRFSPVIELQPGQTVIVKPSRHEQQQRDDSAGGTSLLSIACEVSSGDGSMPLLADDDPARPTDFLNDSRYVRKEKVYLRPVTEPATPFGLLGSPPVSAWLPPGQYEVLVVYGAPTGVGDATPGTRGYPFVTTLTTAVTEKMQKTHCNIPLPHYEHSYASRLRTIGAEGAVVAERLTPGDLGPLLAGIERTLAVPTPAGYLLNFPEPAVRHADDHRDCSFDYTAPVAEPREWTRDQIATLTDWLPQDDACRPAREKLQRLVDDLAWRDYFRGWYLYAAAGVAGLVFTRWGATAVVQPWRKAETFFESLKTMFVIFLLSAGAWLLWTILTDGGGCRGPMPFRVR